MLGRGGIKEERLEVVRIIVFSTMESRLFVRYHFIDRQIVSFYYQMYLPGFYLDIQGVCWVTATYPRRPPSGSMRR